MTKRATIFFLSFLIISCSNGKKLDSEPTAKGKLSHSSDIWTKMEYRLPKDLNINDSPRGSNIPLGGFSGLAILGKTAQGEMQFITVTDRGPNGEPIKTSKKGEEVRPFILPEYAPQIIFLETKKSDNSLSVVKRIDLQGPNGALLIGVPPAQFDLNQQRELPANEAGQSIAADPLGIDVEGISVDDDGHFWLCDEYRPSIMKFSKTGRLEKMYTPEGFYSSAELELVSKKYGSHDFIKQILPKDLRKRRLNRGFEGIAFYKGKVVAALQSRRKKSFEGKENILIIILDTKSEKVKSKLYPVPKFEDAKIGDIAVHNSVVYVLEQDPERKPLPSYGIHTIKNIWDIGDEQVSLEKKLELDLMKAGYKDYEKVEGLAVLDENTLAVVNDNDFGIYEDEKGKTKFSRDRAVVLAIFSRKK